MYTPHKIIATHDYSPSKVEPYIGPNRPGGPSQFDWTANGRHFHLHSFSYLFHIVSALMVGFTYISYRYEC